MSVAQVLSIVVALLGGGGIASAWLASRTTKTVEATKAVAEENRQKLEAQRVEIDRQRTINEAFDRLQAENARLYRRIDELEEELAEAKDGKHP